MSLKIVSVPHPALRQQLPNVTTFDSQLRKLADDMVAAMHKANGVGLAGNQVDRPVRMFVYGMDEPIEYHGKRVDRIPTQVVVNPIITTTDDETDIDEEGCLSVPGLYGPVSRATHIRLQAQNLDGSSFEREVSGYEARILQHETDHLNGILFLDKLTDPTKLRRA